MKLYKIADAPAGERWHSAKTGLKSPTDVELPKNGRQGMATFINGCELEVATGAVSSGVELDEIEQAEMRAVAEARVATTVSERAQRAWEATDIEDFILNRATTAQAGNIFACLGTRFKELTRAG